MILDIIRNWGRKSIRKLAYIYSWATCWCCTDTGETTRELEYHRLLVVARIILIAQGKNKSRPRRRRVALSLKNENSHMENYSFHFFIHIWYVPISSFLHGAHIVHVSLAVCDDNISSATALNYAPGMVQQVRTRQCARRTYENAVRVYAYGMKVPVHVVHNTYREWNVTHFIQTAATVEWFSTFWCEK